LESESGESIRGAGWRREADGIRSWWTHKSGQDNGRVVKPREHYGELKVRWTKDVGGGLADIEWPQDVQPEKSTDLFDWLRAKAEE
jgi:hypothetical protein